MNNQPAVIPKNDMRQAIEGREKTIMTVRVKLKPPADVPAPVPAKAYKPSHGGYPG
jgi:hypothetical protein